MLDIQKIDPNFSVTSAITNHKVAVYNVCQPPFRIFGLIPPIDETDCFRRMPQEIADRVSEGVGHLSRNTAGGRVRFATDSGYFGIHAEMKNVYKIPHMPLTGTAGFDLYSLEDGKEQYVRTFMPPRDMQVDAGFESEFELPEREMREYTLNFPLYSDVKKLYIILDEDAQVESGAAYANEAPIVFYGSSITQGGCASRPGNAYQSFISREYNLDFLNLGFAGNAKGEPLMAEYIAKLNMRAFVFDYDFNAPDVLALKATHEPFYKTIRASHPELPILCVSKVYCKTPDDYMRREIIRDTVEKARAAGDRNIYFVDGVEFEKHLGIGGGIVVDGGHPNDLGFYAMAKVIGHYLHKAMNSAV